MQWIKAQLTRITRKPWNPVVGGIILALINIFIFWHDKRPWGITKAYARWGTWLADIAGLEANQLAYWDLENLRTIVSDPHTWANLGIVAGACFAALLAREWKWKKFKSKKQVMAALIGGWLMGYGARIAFGCNIGGFLNTIGSLSLSGWLFPLGMVLGVYLGTKILLKWLI